MGTRLKLEEDDWSMEIDAEPMHFGQDGLGDFDWSNIADDAPVSLALMATNSEMEYDLKMRDLKLEEKQKELDQALKERDDFKVKLEKWSNAAVLQNEVLNKQRYVSDKSCIGFGVESSSKESDNSSGDETLTDPLYENFKREKAYKAVPPPTGTIIPPRANVSFTGIDELAIRNKVEKTKSSQPEIDRNKVIIEDWVDSDDEETVLNFSEIQQKTVLNSENSETSFENSPDHLIKDCNLHERTFKQTQTHKPKGTQGSRDTRPGYPEEDLKDYAIIDSGCSGSMTGDKDKLSDFKEFKGGYVAFGNDPKGGRITGKGTIKTSCIDFEKVSYVEELKFNLLYVSQICDKKHNVLEYVAAASCCAQVLWMQNQLFDYGFNFMNTEIHIDNESTICIVRNHVLHSKTKHIQIRHHFIRDYYEQRLINVVKVHTDNNVSNLRTKALNLARF
ncbi:hypothetical protein Tco_0966076 [Tanacetum coccineum]